MMEKQKHIPELRFPGYKDDWDKKRYGDIFSFRSTNSYSRENLNYIEGKVKNIHYGDIHTKFKTLFDIEKESIPFINSQINLKGIPNDNYCKEGDLIIADASEDYVDVGKCIEIVNLNSEKVLAGLHTILARPDLHKMSIGFSGYLMKSDKIRLQIKVIAQGTKVLSISIGRLSDINLNVPSLPEQQKIASFLTTVDDKLQSLKKKKELLEQYKKGVMQKIFPSTGSGNTPEIRFKPSSAFDSAQASDSSLIERSRNQQAKDFPEWENKKLGNVVLIRSGLGKEQNVNNTGHRVTRIETISDGTINLEKVGFIEATGGIESYKINKGDILFSNINSVAHIGKTAIADRDLDLYHGMNLLCLRSTNGMNSKFIFYYLNSNKLRNHFKAICNQAVSQASINQTELAKTSLQIPSLSEQAKIANFLSAIDKKIEQVAELVEATEQWKKGLLQKMFV